MMPSYANLSYDNLGPDRQALPEPRPRAQRRDRRHVRREVQHRRRAGPPGARRVAAGQGAAQRRVPVRAQHRPAARALAHRLDDPPVVRARRHQPARRGVPAPRRRGRARPGRRRMARVSSRRGTIELAVRVLAPGGARQLLHPVPLPRGGGQPADDRRDRPVREDPRVQVLRRPDRAGAGVDAAEVAPAEAEPAAGDR